jgi:hypothetical protein
LVENGFKSDVITAFLGLFWAFFGVKVYQMYHGVSPGSWYGTSGFTHPIFAQSLNLPSLLLRNKEGKKLF